MRIAIFGGGSIGSRHAANARALGHEVKIFDKREDRGADPLNSYAWNQFAAEPIGAVMICTPAATHEHVARLLLRQLNYAGPLFVEKPLAVRSDAPIFREWPHLVQMVGYNWRFHPQLQALQQLVAGGGTVHFDLKTDIRRWPGQGYDDPLLECSHEVDLACAWLGEARSIHGGSLDVGHGAWLQLQHAGGDSVIDLRWRRDQAGRTYTLHLAGGTSVLARLSTSADAAALNESYVRELRAFLVTAEHFAAAPAHRGADLGWCDFAQGLRVVEICERVKELATA